MENGGTGKQPENTGLGKSLNNNMALIRKVFRNDEKMEGKQYIALNIKDNGEGISEKHINKIFDRFFRSEFHRFREHGGYGLGLSIVKSIAEAHGGKITVSVPQEMALPLRYTYLYRKNNI